MQVVSNLMMRWLIKPQALESWDRQEQGSDCDIRYIYEGGLSDVQRFTGLSAPSLEALKALRPTYSNLQFLGMLCLPNSHTRRRNCCTNYN